MEIHNAPVATAEMLIRKPASEVFEAFVNPDITTNFWFTKASGRLKAGEDVKWEWELFGVSTTVSVKELVQDERLVIEWDGYSGRTSVAWTFTIRTDGTTFVSITESGFSGSGDEVVKQALDSTGGFTIALIGAK